MNNYVIGYTDHENQYEKNIKNILGGLEGHRSQNFHNFRFFSILLVILKFEILFKNIKPRSVTSMIFFKIIEANLKFR